MRSLGSTVGFSGLSKRHGMPVASFLVVVVLCLFALPAQAQYDGGAGTANDPYLIRTPEQFNRIGASSGDWNKHFKLVADIDLSGNPPDVYHIIGTETTQSFSGVFDGNDHTISNFTLNSTRPWYTGLFGCVSGQIKKLGLIKPKVFSQGSSVGSLAGYLDSGTITGCYAKGADVSGDDYIGGLVGWSTGRIFNCYSTGKASGDWYIGGLVGFIADSTVRHVYLHDENLMIPLIVAWPGGSRQHPVIEAQVRSIDIVPTVLDLLGIQPEPEVEGASLAALMSHGQEDRRRPASSYVPSSNYGMSLRVGNRAKLILNNAAWAPVAGDTEYYRSDLDPTESQNLLAAPEASRTSRTVA